MLIKFKNVQIGDEIIIPSNSNLKYLKVLSKTSKGNFKCSAFKGDKPSSWNPKHILSNIFIFNSNVKEHNTTFYLKDDNGYMDIWLVKREN